MNRVLPVALLSLFVMSGSFVAAMAGPPGVVEVQDDLTVVQAAPAAQVGHHATATGHGPLVDWFGPMPQTCYQPRFGCYPGNPRTIHRYPAFHGYYYRAPYNYRHLFEYPWHAQPYEPQPLHSGGAVEEIIISSEEISPPTEATPAKSQMLPAEIQPLPDPALQQ